VWRLPRDDTLYVVRYMLTVWSVNHDVFVIVG
jgi:hypothetical protein